MARAPFAEWRPVPNFARGQIGPVVGMVVHHMVGSEASAFSRFSNPGSGASAHFGVRFDGSVVQYVDTMDAAYHACQANYQGQVGVENESLPDPAWEPLTSEQVGANGRIARWLHETHGMVLRVADPGDRRGVGYHSMVPGPCAQAWGQTGCPGPAIVAQRDEIVRQAIEGDDMTPDQAAKLDALYSKVVGDIGGPVSMDQRVKEVHAYVNGVPGVFPGLTDRIATGATGPVPSVDAAGVAAAIVAELGDKVAKQVVKELASQLSKG